MHAKTQGGFCKCDVCERPCFANCANFLGDGLSSDRPCTWEWNCAPRRKNNKWTLEMERRDPTRSFYRDSDSDSDSDSDTNTDTDTGSDSNTDSDTDSGSDSGSDSDSDNKSD